MRARSRAVRSRTADLFAPPAPVTRLPVRVPKIALRDSVPVKQLWYAVVFQEVGASSEALSRLKSLCMHAQNFTPFVSIEEPNALLLEIRGSVKLFGTLEKLCAAIDARWRALSLQAHSATTPSTLAALWLARAGAGVHSDDSALLSGQLAQVPLACTGWEEENLRTLRSMGVRQVGEALRLPRAGLARRIGPEALNDLDVALARQLSPRRAFVPRERFKERCDFETEVEHAAYLEKAVEPLIDRCARFLRERQAGVQRFELHLKHRELPPTVLSLGLANITSERGRLLDVTVQRLERLVLPAPVRGMQLISGSLRALSATSLDAFAGCTGATGRDTAPQLVERLRARLGDEAVYGVCLIAEHRPEAAWRRVRQLALNEQARRDFLPVSSADMPRPVWLLTEPQPILKPQVLQGPERIESGWWDGKGVARDYYVARQREGARLWVFQDRHTQCWYLHGVFA